MNPTQAINQDSGDVEWYTPPEIIEAARSCMGSIDLDPASCDAANVRIRAESIFTKEDDGLTKMWWGNVWMNHPFGKKTNPLWAQKIIEEWNDRNINQACCITFAATSEKWFQPLARYPQCFLSPRTNYYRADGTRVQGVGKGSVVTYFGDHIVAFSEAFKQLGVIKVQHI